MNNCFFVSDLHGSIIRYQRLFQIIELEKPSAVFIGGDILPGFNSIASPEINSKDNFVKGYLSEQFELLRIKLKDDYPAIFIILGNDDGKSLEMDLIEGTAQGLWFYANQKRLSWESYSIYGYSYIPPTPFQLKDWEKYDVSRYTDPGCVPPEEGFHTQKTDPDEIMFSTIQEDLQELTGEEDLSGSIFLFHSPPYNTVLDRAALDGKMIDYVPLDVHIGSIAIQRFIESRKPKITLHGHVHESARLTGEWRVKLGSTWSFSAAHDGRELALVSFDPADPASAVRRLLWPG